MAQVAPAPALQRIVGSKSTTLRAAKSVWQNVRGPGAAMIASAWRLQWEVEAAHLLTTDEGRRLDLRKDPPVLVRQEVCQAVRRWRDRRVFAKYPHLGPFEASHGLCLQPLWALLKEPVHEQWTGGHKASLRSALLTGSGLRSAAGTPT